MNFQRKGSVTVCAAFFILCTYFPFVQARDSGYDVWPILTTSYLQYPSIDRFASIWSPKILQKFEEASGRIVYLINQPFLLLKIVFLPFLMITHFVSTGSKSNLNHIIKHSSPLTSCTQNI